MSEYVVSKSCLKAENYLKWIEIKSKAVNEVLCINECMIVNFSVFNVFIDTILSHVMAPDDTKSNSFLYVWKGFLERVNKISSSNFASDLSKFKRIIGS